MLGEELGVGVTLDVGMGGEQCLVDIDAEAGSGTGR